MSNYYRASDAQPSVDDLKEIFARSTPQDWLFDDVSDTFTHKQNLLVFVAGDHHGTYNLKYGHMDVDTLSSQALDTHVFNTPPQP